MARVVILKTGNTYPSLLESFGDFDNWFLAGLDPELDLWVVLLTNRVHGSGRLMTRKLLAIAELAEALALTTEVAFQTL